MVNIGNVVVDDALYEKMGHYLSNDKVELVAKAYAFAEKAHEGQNRLSGEAFFEHPKQTALFLADLRLDASALSAALLHDVLEDCDVTFEELSNEFGSDVAGLVDGVTKLTNAEVMGDSQFLSGSQSAFEETSLEDIAQAETLRKMLMAMAEDVRVVLIKLADRLHNMRTVASLPQGRREAMAKETLEIYAPLAHRLGIWEIKWMLEDLSFQQIDPDTYKQISLRLNTKRGKREEYIQKVVEIVKLELAEAGIEAEVYGRPKHIYSIHKKTEKYHDSNREVSEIYDLFAVRILVNELKDCYGALGAMHTKWRPLPGQFDDYIANPKDNLYQSLHTAVLCEESSPVEIQIRTHDMHEVAEYGVAAHWLYKETGELDIQFEEKMTWLRQLLEWQRDVSGAVEFVESFKTDIFQNQVFVYTPDGDVLELPMGSTPLDFAYRIHTDIGHSCVGAKVNGKLVALNHHLQNGDTIQIMTSKVTRGPSLDWINPSLGYAKTSSARAKMRQWFNRQERQTNIERGKELFQKQIARLDLSTNEHKAAEIFKYKTVDDMFADLGGGSLSTAKLISRISLKSGFVEPLIQTVVPKTGPASGVQVLGVGDLLTNIARCCNPIMGDEITGFITRGRGVTVHRKSCPNITAEDELDRIVPVDWGESRTLYPVRIQLDCWDRVGLLGDVTSVVSNERINIANINSEEYDDRCVISLTVYTNGIDQLGHLYTKLEGVKGVDGVTRLRNIDPQDEIEN